MTDIGRNKSLASDWWVRHSPGKEAKLDLASVPRARSIYLWSLKLNWKQHPSSAHSSLLSSSSSRKAFFSCQARSGGVEKFSALIQGNYFILLFNALVLGSLFKHPCPLHKSHGLASKGHRFCLLDLAGRYITQHNYLLKGIWLQLAMLKRNFSRQDSHLLMRLYTVLFLIFSSSFQIQVVKQIPSIRR